MQNDAGAKAQIREACTKIASLDEILAACFHGPGIYGGSDTADIDALVVISDYAPKIRTFGMRTGDINTSIQGIDKAIFENDVKQGGFGELVAEVITLPYEALVNQTYLEQMEVEMKKRVTLQLLENLILRYPELWMELLIRPEYFMYELMRKRTRLFPPLKHSVLELFKADVKQRNVDAMMKGYLAALKQLETQGYVRFSNNYVRITKKLRELSEPNNGKFFSAFASIQRALIPHTRRISSGIATVLLRGQNFMRENSHQQRILTQLEETEAHLLIPTPLGPVSLSDRTNIEDFVRKTVPRGETLRINIQRMGGVLNSVFLVGLQTNGQTRKVIVKKYEDWLGFKWFPLALWTLGTQSFAVLGKTRLEREYSTNQFLSKHDILVPRILYVSPKEGLIFEEFVEGRKLVDVVFHLASPSEGEEAAASMAILEGVGADVARAHALGVSFGDCKPENILITRQKRACFLDLEQATRNGNQPWDIAELLYYSGHYLLPSQSEVARLIASAFLKGYLRAGGQPENVTQAASPKYTKVFSVFTLPNIILTISNTCKFMGRARPGQRGKKGRTTPRH
jgi:tRNA A-37 threonylcarbamoyl transferase component Bud32